MGEERLQAGTIIGGKYRTDHLLGEGGMGVVVAATHLQLDQPVAIKLLRAENIGRPEVVTRMVREARAVARLHSEHVVRVLDVGTEAGTPFIVMERLVGADLGHIAETQGRVPVATAVDWVLQACDAVGEAHALGIVHRDLKPANLFLSQSAHGAQTIKVLDFGIAKTAAFGDLGLTGTSTVMGSPAFMSPEQLRSSRNVDGRTDVWSLGVILWQLVIGTLPFQGESFTEICVHIVVDPLPRMPKVPGVPSALEAVLRRCLEKDPEERFASIGELAEALAQFAPPARRELAHRLARQAAVPVPASPEGDSTVDRANGQRAHATVDRPRANRSRRMLAGAIVASVAVAAAAVALVASTPREPPAAAAKVPDEPPTIVPLSSPPPPPVVTTLPEPAAAPPPVEATPDAAPPPPPEVVEAPVAETPRPAARRPRSPEPPREPKPPSSEPEVDPFSSAD
jgi:serine/threonine-protein kinase